MHPALTAPWTLSADPYNTANIISHAVQLCMLVSTIMLNFPTEGTADEWITPERIGLALAILQVRATTLGVRRLVL